MESELQRRIRDGCPAAWDFGDADDPESARLLTALFSYPETVRLKEDFLAGKYKVYFAYAGSRSGKSVLAKRLALSYAAKHRNSSVLYCGPTANQVRNIAWDDFVKMTNDGLFKMYVQDIKESQLTILLKNGSKITLYSLDDPRRVRGQLISGLVIDEAADVPDGTWKELYPMIQDRQKSWAIVISTPGGCRGDFYDLYAKIKSNPEDYKDFGMYHWHRGLLMGDEVLEAGKRSMDKLSFAEEMLGEFTQGSGQAYLFDRLRHLSDSVRFNSSLPIDVGADFNVNIMPWVVAQSSPDLTMVIDEVVGRQCTIEHMCNMVKSRVQSYCGGDFYLAQRHQIRFYGDATAAYVRDPSAHVASWTIIKDQFRGWNVEFKLSKQNPRVGDRIALTNARLLTADGNIHCLISPRVKELVLDFEAISYDDIMQGQKDRLGSDRSHASDAFGYYCWRLYKTYNSSAGVRTLSMR